MGDDYKPSNDTRWVDIQKRTFTRWANNFLVEKMMKIDDIGADLHDGLLLINLLEVISGKPLGTYNKKPKIRAQKLENTGLALKFLKDEGIKLVAIGPEDITDGALKLILGMIWTIILRYQINKIAGGAGSAKQELLEWVRRKIPECNVNNFTESWKDGRAICHLDEALKPGSCPNLDSLRPGDGLQNAIKGTDAAESELQIPKILAPEDMVAAADELSCMTYISYFRDYEANEGKRREADRLAKIADPSKCIAYGPGLEHADTGIPAEFTIQARNASGANIPVGGEQFQVTVTGASPNITPRIVDNGNGTYGVTYVATQPGKHTIHVNLKGKPISGSPWTVPVDRAGADPTKSEVYGPGIEGGVQGEPAVFTIASKNRIGEPIKTGGDPYKVDVKGPHNKDLDVKVQDNHNGTYTVTYVPVDAGPHTVAVTLEGRHVAKSPYHVGIDRPKGYPDALRCWADGPGLKGGDTANPAVFTIHAADQNGRPVTPKENPFLVDITRPDGSELIPDVVDNRDGTYTVTYKPTEPGDHEIVVGLKNPAAPLYYDHIKDSPFHVGIKPGTDAAQTKVYGPGIEDGVKDNEPTHFTIEARDPQGKPLGKGGDPFEVKVDGPTGPVPVDLKDNGDGTYTARYQPDAAGPTTIKVNLKDKPVANSPYRINVKEGADPKHSFVEGYSFVIRLRTKTGKNLLKGGENFTVEIHDPSGRKVENVQVTDVGDGTYLVRYSLPENVSGKFKFEAKTNGKHIRGSPWDQILS